jgi:hypothetical protein
MSSSCQSSLKHGWLKLGVQTNVKKILLILDEFLSIGFGSMGYKRNAASAGVPIRRSHSMNITEFSQTFDQIFRLDSFLSIFTQSKGMFEIFTHLESINNISQYFGSITSGQSLTAYTRGQAEELKDRQRVARRVGQADTPGRCIARPVTASGFSLADTTARATGACLATAAARRENATRVSETAMAR